MRGVVVSDSAFVRMDERLHSADAVRAFAALFAPNSARVSRPFDFVSVGTHETDVVGCSVVHLTSGRTDSQYEFRHVTTKRTSIQQLIISRTKIK